MLFVFYRGNIVVRVWVAVERPYYTTIIYLRIYLSIEVCRRIEEKKKAIKNVLTLVYISDGKNPNVRNSKTDVRRKPGFLVRIRISVFQIALVCPTIRFSLNC